MITFSVSLVTYHPDLAVLAQTLSSLCEAVSKAEKQNSYTCIGLYIIDNGSDSFLHSVVKDNYSTGKYKIISGHGNIGFGKGHNLVIFKVTGDFHLILNPDVYMESDSLNNALDFMVKTSSCSLISPAVYEKQATQEWKYLCKRFPTIFDLFLRGFAPRRIQKLFKNRMDLYELADKNQPEILWDPPIASGCFMLCRTTCLQEIGGFDPRFFLYFEDFDLSLRIAKTGRIAGLSTVKIIHLGGNASRKGFLHIKFFCKSMLLFFIKYRFKNTYNKISHNSKI